MYCSNCGKENPDDAVYCQKCGKLLEAEEETRVAGRVGMPDYLPPRAQKLSRGRYRKCVYDGSAGQFARPENAG